jgi:tetratricopeptide (TPR) repeat protein/tRNA A-37 threonylcarbamoyl transferase component Bud32
MTASGRAPDTLRDQLDRALGGTYRIEREIGGGGMSRVFLAEETALGRRVVVKILSAELTHELSAERFTREIRLSARLQHPNIVPVLAAGTASGMPYYTMPFVDGESLRARLRRLAPGELLPLPHVVHLLRDVARALAYAHSLGVVHRDIKPENVLLSYDAAVVADFGVAKALVAARTQQSGSLGMPTLTSGGMALGTPAYMSPEQAAGDPNVDHRADLYAWGVMAYELLSGRHPFADRHSVQALVTAHLIEQPRSLNDVASHVPPPIGGLVMRCLSKAPDERPRDARTILEALDGAVTPEAGVAAGTATPAAGRLSAALPPSRTGWHRSRVRVLTALGIGVVAAGGALAYRMLGNRGAVVPSAAASRRASQGSPGYDAYIRGRVRLSNENRQDNDAAIVALRDAIAKDPSLAPAYATLARALTVKIFYFATDSEKNQLTEDADIAIAKALELDPNSADAYYARGLLLWTPGNRFPHEQAIRAYRRALTLDPKLDEAHHQLAVVLFHVGLLDEAQAHIDTAVAINPGNTLARFRYGVIDLYRGQYERAYRIFNSTAVNRNPTLTGYQTASALFRLGREREAQDVIDRYLRDNPQDQGGVGTSVQAMMLAKNGRRADAEAAIGRSLKLGRTFGHFHHTAYNVASAYAMLGNRVEAMRWLQVAADDGFPCYPLFANDRQLDGLRRDSSFIAFLARMKSDWEERKRTL